MKILTEKEQLEKKREELFTLIRFQEEAIEDLRLKINKKMNKVFSNKLEISFLNGEKDEMKRVADALYEYRNDINFRIEALKNKS